MSIRGWFARLLIGSDGDTVPTGDKTSSSAEMGASWSKLVTYKFTLPIKHVLLHLEQFIELNLSMFAVVNEQYITSFQAIEKDSPDALKDFVSINKEASGSLWFQLFR